MTIDTYLGHIELTQRTQLEHIRAAVKQIAPEVEEVISYGMPGFKYRGKYLLGFAAFKDHLSLFPTAGPIEAYESQLADFKISKGTIQFTPNHPISDALLEKLVRHRLASIDE